MNILDYMKEHFLYLDGGMGTLLQARGLEPGAHPEGWNLTHPDEIVRIHRAYLEAGSNVVNTNTFGANGLKFTDEELESIIREAIRNARRAQEEAGVSPSWVALDIGPCGKLLAPYGDFDFEDAVALFSQVVTLGVKYGVDLIFIETMSDSYETKAALLAAKENCSLPVFVSNAYQEDGKLMTGASPAAMVALLEGMGADAIGANCSLGPKELMGVMDEYLTLSSLPVLLKPNAGLPRVENGVTIFDVTPGDFADTVAELMKGGVRIAGGCCGTTPEYIKALTEASRSLTPVPVTPKEIPVISSYTHAVSLGKKPILIGERLNPTGKKRFKEALRNNDISYILQVGLDQQDAGCDVLDVNVGLPEIDEPKLLTEVVNELQAVSNLPLQIDTSDYLAMEMALRRVNGKAMINSVNGKQEIMDEVFPLAKKYGGLVVALTLDEDGIPETAEGRFAIAEKILKEASKYGLGKKDLIFDPLAMTVSADSRAARETLRSIRMIHDDLGCLTSLGVSNISFGLPQRELVNSFFFALAMENGLSAAIMNPHSLEMRKAYHSFLTLDNQDPNCMDFINFATALPALEVKTGDLAGKTSSPSANAGSAASAFSQGDTPLQTAIIKGLKEQASELTKGLLETVPPLEIISKEIIPALDIVGVGFEKKIIYLPSLLMSAEASKAAFEQIKLKMPTDESALASSGKGPVVLATVKGDIHDIGKNIVRLLLENYGYRVVDLGRDVPPETVAETVRELKAPLAGLSALMTTTVPSMEATIKLLRQECPWCKIMVGGAVMTQEYADTIGSDKYAKDAMEGVRYAEKVCCESR